jgi:hypothetical protein
VRDVVCAGASEHAHCFLLIVRSTLTIHVALSDKSPLPLAVAHGSKNLGREMESSIVANGCGPRVDDSLDDPFVGPSGVVSVGELGLGREGDVLEPV